MAYCRKVGCYNTRTGINYCKDHCKTDMSKASGIAMLALIVELIIGFLYLNGQQVSTAVAMTIPIVALATIFIVATDW